MQIIIYPKAASNSYTEDLRRILSKGDVQVTCENIWDTILKTLKSPFRIIVILNWIDNWPYKNGQFNYLRSILLINVLLILRVFSKKIFFTRHNVYPHVLTYQPSNINLLYKFIRVLVNKIYCHSEVFSDKHNYTYIPYPLPSKNYSQEKKSKNISLPFEEYYLIFGRIEAYKQIDEVIKIFNQSTEKLLIVGKGDQQLVQSYKNLANNNIAIIPEYLTTNLLNELIINSKGVIVHYMSNSMIVASPIFHCLSVGGSLLCKKNFFSSETKSYIGADLLIYQNTEELLTVINSISSKPGKDTFRKLNSRHSDENILARFKDSFS